MTGRDCRQEVIEFANLSLNEVRCINQCFSGRWGGSFFGVDAAAANAHTAEKVREG
jgi:hypothetical protein